MPKLRPATGIVAALQQEKILCKEIVDLVKEWKAVNDLLDIEVTQRLKTSQPTWSKMKKGDILGIRFSVILTAIRCVGYEFKLEKIAPPPPKNKKVIAPKADTYGTIIEGFIRQIAQEMIDKDKEGK